MRRIAMFVLGLAAAGGLAACGSSVETQVARSATPSALPSSTTPAIAATSTPEPELPQSSPTPLLPPLPTVEISTEKAVVFDSSEESCAGRDMPDLPARAFRDAVGQVVLFAGDIASRRMVGPSLTELTHECQPVMRSSYDPDPSHYDFEEWIGAVYTTDGEHVDALVHMEYHGERAADWHAERDFSSTQGERDWHYNQRVGDEISEMVFNPDDNRWIGAAEFCLISNQIMHPGEGCDAVRTWVSPLAGEISIRGDVRDLDPYGGDGVEVELLLGDELVWSASIENAGSAQLPEDLTLNVDLGDSIYFIVSARDTNHNDSTLWNPEIDLGPHPCPSRDVSRCQMMAVTYASSSDGGQTFDQPPVPAHLVAASPYRYEEDAEAWGIWQPSNIIRHPLDGYYYAAVHVEDHGLQPRGTCMMRTDDLSDPSSWRAWDGDSYSVEFVNPYVGDDDPSGHICQPVSADEIWTLSYSLTYNQYLEAFILLGHAVHVDTPGFYYALSRDLVHWTPRTLLMEADLVQTTETPGRYLAYPSLLDPVSPGFNFDVTGESPYLFYSRFNDASAGNVDLVRVQVTFSR